MSLPYSDPANPALPSPLFSDLSAARGDHLRANNNAIFNDLTYLDDLIAALDDAIPPVGTIIARLSGYFSNGSNGSFTQVDIPIDPSWQLCNGAAYNNALSPIFNTTGRYLPNLSDNRFLMGSNTVGAIGGQNSTNITSANLPPHVHTISHDHGNHSHPFSGTTSNAGAHTHNVPSYPGTAGTGSGIIYKANESYNYSQFVLYNGDHAHTFSGTTGTAGVSFAGASGNGSFANSAIENRPSYLSAKYFIRVY